MASAAQSQDDQAIFFASFPPRVPPKAQDIEETIFLACFPGMKAPAESHYAVEPTVVYQSGERPYTQWFVSLFEAYTKVFVFYRVA